MRTARDNIFVRSVQFSAHTCNVLLNRNNAFKPDFFFFSVLKLQKKKNRY